MFSDSLDLMFSICFSLLSMDVLLAQENSTTNIAARDPAESRWFIAMILRGRGKRSRMHSWSFLVIQLHIRCCTRTVLRISFTRVTQAWVFVFETLVLRRFCCGCYRAFRFRCCVLSTRLCDRPTWVKSALRRATGICNDACLASSQC